MSEMRAREGPEPEMGVSPERFCRVLELAISDSPLEATLGELLGIVESTSKTGVLGSILLLDQDGKHLRHGAAPSLGYAWPDAVRRNHGASLLFVRSPDLRSAVVDISRISSGVQDRLVS